MQIAILKIGFSEFAFRKPANASKVLELLSESVQVQSEYTHDQGKVFQPADPESPASRHEISLELVSADRLTPLGPSRVPRSRRLNDHDSSNDLP